jgi:hypothetical protein
MMWKAPSRLWHWWCEVPEVSRYANRGQLITGLALVLCAMSAPVYIVGYALHSLPLSLPYLGNSWGLELLELLGSVVYICYWIKPSTKILDWWWS